MSLANVRGLELSQQYGGECDKRQDTPGYDNERSFRIGVQLFIIHSRQRRGPRRVSKNTPLEVGRSNYGKAVVKR